MAGRALEFYADVLGRDSIDDCGSRKFFDFVLLEADEGRLRPGPKATILKFLYNTVMMPVVYRMFMRDERNRKGRDPAPSDTALNRR